MQVKLPRNEEQWSAGRVGRHQLWLEVLLNRNLGGLNNEKIANSTML